jgi:hypothetical protein
MLSFFKPKSIEEKQIEESQQWQKMTPDQKNKFITAKFPVVTAKLESALGGNLFHHEQIADARLGLKDLESWKHEIIRLQSLWKIKQQNVNAFIGNIWQCEKVLDSFLTMPGPVNPLSTAFFRGTWLNPFVEEMTDFCLSPEGHFLLAASKKQRSLLLFNPLSCKLMQTIVYPQNGDSEKAYANQAGWAHIQGILSLWVLTSSGSLHVYPQNGLASFSERSTIVLCVFPENPSMIKEENLPRITFASDGVCLVKAWIDKIEFFNLNSMKTHHTIKLNISVLRIPLLKPQSGPYLDNSPKILNTIKIIHLFFNSNNTALILHFSNRRYYKIQDPCHIQSCSFSIDAFSREMVALNQDRCKAISYGSDYFWDYTGKQVPAPGAVWEKDYEYDYDYGEKVVWNCSEYCDERFWIKPKNQLYQFDWEKLFISHPKAKKASPETDEIQGTVIDNPVINLFIIQHKINQLHLNPTGEKLIFSNPDGWIALFNLDNLSIPLLTLRLHTTAIKQIFFTADGGIISIAQNKQSQIEMKKWDLRQWLSAQAIVGAASASIPMPSAPPPAPLPLSAAAASSQVLNQPPAYANLYPEFPMS